MLAHLATTWPGGASGCLSTFYPSVELLQLTGDLSLEEALDHAQTDYTA